MADACAAERRPLVTAAVGRFDGSLTVLKPYETAADGRRNPSYRDLFPEPPPAGLVPSCAEAGVVGALTGVIGTLQAMEVIKLITGIGEPLVGRLLLYDALGGALRHDPLQEQGVTPRQQPTLRSTPIPAGFEALGRAAGGHPRRPSPIWTAIIDPPSSAHRLTPETLRAKAQAEIGFLALGRRHDRRLRLHRRDRPTISISASSLSLPAHQGRGVGRRLLEAAERHAAGAGKPLIELQTRVELTGNQRAFRSLGFRRDRAHRASRL